MDLKKLRELADRLIETMADPYHHDAFSLALSDYRHVTGPTAILTLLDALKNMGLDADHTRQERDAMQAENETLRAVLRDIMTERLIPAEYPMLAARAKAALDGGGV